MGGKSPVRFEADSYDRKLLKEQDDALAANPNNVVANCNKGLILLDLCDSAGALECYERALRQDPYCMEAWIGKGRALTMQEDYDGAEKCFSMVPEGDEYYDGTQDQSIRNKRYRDRRGRVRAGAESDDEREFNDELERWVGRHLDRIQNLRAFLHKFRCARDCRRRKAGNVFHAWLVRKFYEHDGPLKVVAVERQGIEPKTDVDIVLSDDVYVQAWHGKISLGYTIDRQIWSGDNTPLDMDWCEELKPVQKKLRQLPSNTGKGFVINFSPGMPPPPYLPLHHLCNERKCVMTMTKFNGNQHIIVYGTSDFKYRDEACQIAQMLERPVRFVLGDWDELRKQKRNPMLESAYGHDPDQPPYIDLIKIYFQLGQARQYRLHSQSLYSDSLRARDIKQQLLNYAKDVLNHPSCADLTKLDCEDLYLQLYSILLLKDSDCPEN